MDAGSTVGELNTGRFVMLCQTSIDCEGQSVTVTVGDDMSLKFENYDISEAELQVMMGDEPNVCARILMGWDENPFKMTSLYIAKEWTLIRTCLESVERCLDLLEPILAEHRDANDVAVESVEWVEQHIRGMISSEYEFGLEGGWQDKEKRDAQVEKLKRLVAWYDDLYAGDPYWSLFESEDKALRKLVEMAGLVLDVSHKTMVVQRTEYAFLILIASAYGWLKNAAAPKEDSLFCVGNERAACLEWMRDRLFVNVRLMESNRCQLKQ